MLDAFRQLLCSKLCKHNRLVPSQQIPLKELSNNVLYRFCASILTALLEYLELKAFPLKRGSMEPPRSASAFSFKFSYNELYICFLVTI